MNLKEREEVRKRKAAKKEQHSVQDRAMQTIPNTLDTTPMMYYNGQLIPVHPDALDLIPERVCFEVKICDKHVVLRKMNLPDESGKQCQRAALNKKLLQTSILR